MPIDEPKLSPREIAKRIRIKVADLNEDLILAALAEVDIEFEIRKNHLENTQLVVWCRQEV